MDKKAAIEKEAIETYDRFVALRDGNVIDL